MDPIEGGVAIKCVANILAARVEELRRVMAGRHDPLIARVRGGPDKHEGRAKQLDDLTARLHRIGHIMAHRADPDHPPLTPVPADVLGRLCALASGDQAQRRVLRDLATDTALRILEVLEACA